MVALGAISVWIKRQGNDGGDFSHLISQWHIGNYYRDSGQNVSIWPHDLAFLIRPGDTNNLWSNFIFYINYHHGTFGPRI